MRFSNVVFGLVISFLSGWVGVVGAQPTGAVDDNFTYRVEAGDTLGELSERYTLNWSNWQRLQLINQISEDTQLPIARELRIPFSMIPEVAALATVSSLRGSAVSNGTTLSEGATLTEGQILETDEASFVTLTLSDGTLLTIPPQSKLEFTRLRSFEKEDLIDAIITITEGSLEAVVAPEGQGVGRFEIRGPASVTGVRGTRLRAHTGQSGSRTELLTGVAQVNTQQSGLFRLQEAQGLVVDAGGSAVGPKALLPAPQIGEPHRGPSGWELAFEPLEGAVAYIVTVARQESGSFAVSQKRIAASPARFNAPGPGDWYVLVRAVDAQGLGGLEAAARFPGRLVLQTSDGSPVLTAAGDYVTLSD